MHRDPPILAAAPLRQKRVAGIGELVWDRMPEGDRLGGAPANFVVMAARLGDHGIVASRIGADALGQRAFDILADLPVDLEYLQTDAEYPTGAVNVSFDHSTPQYEILQPASWDFLDFNSQWRALARSVDAVCFGTLGQRHPHARKAIHAFLDCTTEECLRVFDVNLRRPFFDAQTLHASMPAVNLLKMNDEEAPRILSLLGAPPAATANISESSLFKDAQWLLNEFPQLELVCITLGAAGSLLVNRREYHRHPGLPCTVKDSVGAGDAFTAALVHYALEGAPLAVLNEAGNRWGSWVASQPGAMPPLDAATLAGIAQAIEEMWR
jgi:fructokinase